MSKPENHSLNERCSVCGMPLRMMRGGSMTQWISTCACAGIRLQKDNLSKSLNCSTCKKRIRLGKHGSITNWVFQDDVCSCVTSKPILPVMAADRDETAKEEDRQSTEFNITDTTFPLDRYEPRAILGIGSAGIVYLAKDLKSNKDVAVKLLHLPEEEELLRFQKEARSTSKLNHPKIVKVLDFGVTGNVPYLVLEYIEGVTLFKLIDSAGALSLDTALEIALQICQGVEHAHNKGILHGDLNPENILVVTQFLDDPEIRIIDFGIARL
ncbi:MAG: serine/threonine protein kinase, partial [Candidatus Obscuribacterales bacterium]|nr:serine/threonine protein kinase [Candidatus Obscuribacterales bacterium]